MRLRPKLVVSLLVGIIECTLGVPGFATDIGRTFFVSAASGQDGNDGVSPQTPWKSLARVNAAELRPGDKVLFQRGDVLRGNWSQGAAATVHRSHTARMVMAIGPRCWGPSAAMIQPTGRAKATTSGRLKNSFFANFLIPATSRGHHGRCTRKAVRR